MKIKQIATAISAVLLSSSAFAIPPGTVPQIEVFMSGASAQDKAIGFLFDSICAIDPITGKTDLSVYKDNSNPAKPGKADTAYFCTVDNSKVIGGFSDGLNKTVLFHKRSKGGSGEGVNPVINETPIDAMNINNNNCTQAAGESFYRCDITTLDANGNPIGLYKKVSDAGVSDVNPGMFVGANAPAGVPPVDIVAVAQRMVVKSAAAAVFGIPVTVTLRDALQEAQFPGNTTCTTYDPSITNPLLQPRESQACMPNLTARQVASLAAGKIRNWSAFKVNGVALTAVAGVTPPTSTKVTFCRRVNGSGTQAQMNANFLHYPCTSNAAQPAFAGNPYAGPVVVRNEGSGDLSVCLDDFNNGTNATGLNIDGITGAPVTAWAFGLQSTEKNGDLKDDYRFVKIDGVAPTIQNAASGKYLDWAEQTFQWRKPVYNGPTGDQLTVINTIASTASNPTTIGNLDSHLIQTWGQGGYLAVSTNFPPSVNGILDITAPVIPYTHAASGKLDNCTIPLLNDAYQNLQL